MGTNWLFWAGAIVAAACGAAMLAWALFSDRSRGRKRCPKCWYSMEQAPSLRCPECGHEPKHEKKLHKTRRRWKWALASVLPLAVAAYLAIQPKVQRDGWASVMPTTALILCLNSRENEWCLDALYHRTWNPIDPYGQLSIPEQDLLWQWQWRLLAHTCIRLIQDERQPSRTRHTYFAWLTLTMDFIDDAATVDDIHKTIVRLLNDSDPTIRQMAAIHSVRIEEPAESLNRLQSLIHDEDPLLRIGVIAGASYLFRATGDAAAFRLIRANLDDPDVGVQRAALASISSHGDRLERLPDDLRREAISQIEGMAEHPDSSIQHWRISALIGLYDEHRAWNTIRIAIRSDNPGVREHGLQELDRREPIPPDLIPDILAALNDASPGVVMAVNSLFLRLSRDDLQFYTDELISLSQHEDANIRHHAVSTLIDVRGDESESDHSPMN